MLQDKSYALAMALMNDEPGYTGFQYLAIGTGDDSWDTLTTPPPSAPSATQLFPYPDQKPAQIQRLQFINNPLIGSTFQLGFNGVNTGVLSFDPSVSGSAKAAIMQIALQALSTIGTGNITVSAEGAESYLISFAGNLGSGPQPLITAVTTGLLGSTTPTISISAVNNPSIVPMGEFARFPIDTRTYIDENGVALSAGLISRYCRLSVTIPANVMTPVNISASPIVFREMAWVGGNATSTLGTGMYLSIVRFTKQIRRFGDGAITLSSNIMI